MNAPASSGATSSPAYGERWACHWLDVVRYTDSFDARIVDGAGNTMDVPEIWRYRDWVVGALNADMPYDRFVKHQIAGDVLPGAGTDGVVATGMLAIGNWGGGDADKEKLLTDIADDQVDVVGRAFLGLTLACARCHDHKFDAISTRDYYAVAGFLKSSRYHLAAIDPPARTREPMRALEAVNTRLQALLAAKACRPRREANSARERPSCSAGRL